MINLNIPGFMTYIVFGLIVIMLIYISYKNIVVLSRYKNNKDYIDSYKGVLNKTDSAIEDISNFINNSKSLEFKSKASILKIYCELENNLDYSETLNNIDLKQIFYKKDKLSFSQYKLNCDSFIFMMLVMARAHVKKKDDVVLSIANKVFAIKELENTVEYQEVKALNDTLLRNEDKGLKFSKDMLEGSYTTLRYEKNLIGLYKRIASVILAYNNKLDDEYFLNDLHRFANTLIGKNLMQDMKLYDKYPPFEESK